MDFELTDDQRELQRIVREVLESEAPTSLARGVTEGSDSADGLWETLTGLDWPALCLPEAVGGLGHGWVELAILLEEMGGHVVPGPFAATLAHFAPAVLHAGTVEQQERFLAPVAAGVTGATGTLALDEGAGTWDPGQVRATAVPDGDSLVLSGTKCFVVDGTTAAEVAVVVRMDGHLRIVVVPGEVASAREVDPIDATTRHATLELEGVRVGADRLLAGSESEEVVVRALQEATVGVAASTLGACQRILDLCLDHARERQQFGVPIGSFQAVKHKLADMYCQIERARALVYFAALVFDANDDRRAIATSMAKAASGECQRRCVRDGLQLFGGIGYTWEHELHLFLRRATVGELHFGSSSRHRRWITRCAMSSAP